MVNKAEFTVEKSLMPKDYKLENLAYSKNVEKTSTLSTKNLIELMVSLDTM
jgi:hypothetical protein